MLQRLKVLCCNDQRSCDVTYDMGWGMPHPIISMERLSVRGYRASSQFGGKK